MKPFYWAILAAIAWGCAPILEKLGLSKIPVFTGLVFRSIGVLVGAIILILFQLQTVKEAFLKLPQGWGLLVLGGLVASIIGQIFFYHGLKNGEASLMVPLAASYPLISFILGVVFLGEQVSLAKISGLLLIIAGVFLLK